MLLLVQIDLAEADVPAFDDYEAKALALLPLHCGQLIERLRAVDGRSETHLLHFPDAAHRDAFLADPMRAAMAPAWIECGATAAVVEVRRIGMP